MFAPFTLAYSQVLKLCNSLFKTTLQTTASMLAVTMLFNSQPALGQLSTTQVVLADLPAELHYPGQLLDAQRWQDKRGEHLLLLSVVDTSYGTAPADSSWQLPARHQRLLHATLFLLNTGQSTLQWSSVDGQERCILDAQADFVRTSPMVTDLDQDGTTELWLGYKTSCSSSIGTQKMKVILYMNDQAFSMEGESLLHKSVKGLDDPKIGFVGGRYRFDQAFRHLPRSFRQFARAYWATNALDIR